MGTAVAITARTETERALRDSERRLQRVLAVGTVVAYSLLLDDRPPQLGWVSPGIERLGYAPHEVLNAEWWRQRAHSADQPAVEKAWTRLLRDGHAQHEYQLQKKDGTYAWVREDQVLVAGGAGEQAEIIGAWMDVTERRLMEDQVQHGQRLENLELLATGIVHDLNNILAPVLMVPALLHDPARDARDPKLLDILERSAQRGAALVRQILTFAHREEGEAIALPLKHLLRDLVDMIEATFPRTIALECDVPSELFLVQGRSTQLQQVFLNLCVNARDAMPGGGRLTLRATKM